jgi:hypothetical protein
MRSFQLDDNYDVNIPEDEQIPDYWYQDTDKAKVNAYSYNENGGVFIIGKHFDNGLMTNFEMFSSPKDISSKYRFFYGNNFDNPVKELNDAQEMEKAK